MSLMTRGPPVCRVHCGASTRGTCVVSLVPQTLHSHFSEPIGVFLGLPRPRCALDPGVSSGLCAMSSTLLVILLVLRVLLG